MGVGRALDCLGRIYTAGLGWIQTACCGLDSDSRAELAQSDLGWIQTVHRVCLSQMGVGAEHVWHCTRFLY